MPAVTLEGFHSAAAVQDRDADLAFIPLTTSVFWGSMAVTLVGGTIGGTVLTLLFLPALYAIWFRIRADDEELSVARMQPVS